MISDDREMSNQNHDCTGKQVKNPATFIRNEGYHLEEGDESFHLVPRMLEYNDGRWRSEQLKAAVRHNYLSRFPHTAARKGQLLRMV